MALSISIFILLSNSLIFSSIFSLDLSIFSIDLSMLSTALSILSPIFSIALGMSSLSLSIFSNSSFILSALSIWSSFSGSSSALLMASSISFFILPSNSLLSSSIFAILSPIFSIAIGMSSLSLFIFSNSSFIFSNLSITFSFSISSRLPVLFMALSISIFILPCNSLRFSSQQTNMHSIWGPDPSLSSSCLSILSIAFSILSMVFLQNFFIWASFLATNFVSLSLIFLFASFILFTLFMIRSFSLPVLFMALSISIFILLSNSLIFSSIFSLDLSIFSIDLSMLSTALSILSPIFSIALGMSSLSLSIFSNSSFILSALSIWSSFSGSSSALLMASSISFFILPSNSLLSSSIFAILSPIFSIAIGMSSLSLSILSLALSILSPILSLPFILSPDPSLSSLSSFAAWSLSFSDTASTLFLPSALWSSDFSSDDSSSSVSRFLLDFFIFSDPEPSLSELSIGLSESLLLWPEPSMWWPEPSIEWSESSIGWSEPSSHRLQIFSPILHCEPSLSGLHWRLVPTSQHSQHSLGPTPDPSLDPSHILLTLFFFIFSDFLSTANFFIGFLVIRSCNSSNNSSSEGKESLDASLLISNSTLTLPSVKPVTATEQVASLSAVSNVVFSLQKATFISSSKSSCISWYISLPGSVRLSFHWTSVIFSSLSTTISTKSSSSISSIASIASMAPAKTYGVVVDVIIDEEVVVEPVPVTPPAEVPPLAVLPSFPFPVVTPVGKRPGPIVTELPVPVCVADWVLLFEFPLLFDPADEGILVVTISSSWPWVASKIIATSNRIIRIAAITAAMIFAPFDTAITRENVEKDKDRRQQKPAI